MISRQFFLPLYLLIMAHPVDCWSDTGPDPIILLQGVEGVREQIPPSRLHIRTLYEGSFSGGEPEYMVLFNRELRYFASTNGDSPMRMLFDGKDVLRFDGASSVILRNLDTQTPDYLFDPRLLGITTSYGWDATIHGS